MDRPHWSYSQLSQFLRCPLQFYFQRVLKLKAPFVSSSLVLGGSVHEALAEYHRSLQANLSPDEKKVKQAFLRAWHERDDQQEIQFRDGESPVSLQEQGLALIDAYLKEPPPENIVAVEKEMLVPLHNSQGDFLERPLVAVIDLLTREDQYLVVSEFKTSGRRYAESEVHNALQATSYAHAVQQRYEQLAVIKYVVLVKTKKPAIQRLETVREPLELGRLGSVVEGVERAIAANAFYPIESPLNCTSCPYRQECRDWQGTFGTQATELPILGSVEELQPC